MESLLRFLQAHNAPKGTEHTHTSMVTPKGLFSVPDQHMGEFYSLYESALRADPPPTIGITEKHKAFGPVLIDIDLRFPVPAEHDPGAPLVRAYKNGHVDDIVRLYLREIGQYTDVDGRCAYVMEKPSPRLDKAQIKDGFHVVIPDIVTSPEFQVYLRKRLLARLAPIIDELGTVNPVEDVVDKQVIKSNNWLMVGSGKGDGSGVYRVTRVLQYHSVDDCLEEAPLLGHDADYVQLLSIRNKMDRISSLKEWEADETDASVRAPGPTVSTYDAILMKQLLSLLSKSRWDNYDEWLKIAIALKNAGDGGDVYKHLFIEFSRISPKFDEEACNMHWGSVCKDAYDGAKVTLGTLKMWAMEDNPYGYDSIFVPREIIDNYNDGDAGLAKIVAYTMHDRLKITGDMNKSSVYFLYDTTKKLWVECNERYVSTDVSDALKNAVQRVVDLYRGQLDAAVATSADESVVDAYTVKLKGAEAIMRRVRSRAGTFNPLAFTSKFLMEPNFVLKLDQHKHLLGVRNGVVDLRTGQLRERTMDDYIYRVVDVDYDVDADTSGMDQFVLGCMADDRDVADFIQQALGYGITGDVREQIFMIFIGTGRNGKSLLLSLLARILGPYYYTVDTSHIVERDTRNNFLAERGMLQGKRIASALELKGDEKLRVDEIKLLSGGDVINGRPLYCNPINFMPSHLMIIATNHYPTLDQSDMQAALKERLLSVPFPVSFTLKEGEPASAVHRRADSGLEEKLLANPAGILRWLVTGSMAWYAGRGLKNSVPAKVRDATDAYFRDQDVYGRFIAECCMIGNPAFRVASTEMYTAFKIWLNVENINDRSVNKQKLVKAAFEAKGCRFERCQRVVKVTGHEAVTSCFVNVQLSPAGRALARERQRRGLLKMRFL